jgi:hypothetical protein
MKKLLTTLVFLMIVSVTISACNANDESPAEKKFIECTGAYFDALAKCNATAAQYRTEYTNCLLSDNNLYKDALKKCKGSIQEQLSCRLEAQETYSQAISICTSAYNTNSALVTKCQDDAYKAYAECK